jgi:hypothetical protein
VNLPHKFKEQAAQKGSDYTAPPYRIRGSDLDENFNMVKPKSHVGSGPDVPYRVSESDQGWELVFPWWPPPQEGTWVLGVINGTIDWIPTEECEEP